MEPFKILSSKTVNMPAANIDTDQIYPARFLTTTTKEGLKKLLFADRRYLSDGSPDPNFILNWPETAGRRILVAGANFGCGSSREHTPWSLIDYGFRAIISTELADIFRANCMKNGLLPVITDSETLTWLLANTEEEITIHLEALQIVLPGGRHVPFLIEPFGRHCLLHGIDELTFLLSKMPDIKRYEENLGKQ